MSSQLMKYQYLLKGNEKSETGHYYHVFMTAYWDHLLLKK